LRLHVRSVLDVAHVLGGKEHILDMDEGAAVGGLISLLLARYGDPLEALLLQSRDPMELLPHVKVYVNGRGVDFIDGLYTALRDGDDVLLMPQIGGG